jgi:hypothetical protein
MAAMGQFHVTARLTGALGRSETVDLLVDTGATLLVVPQPSLLGAVALESLFLAVDPVATRLVPVKGYAAVMRAPRVTPRPAAVAR